jgi:hypothetical protein
MLLGASAASTPGVGVQPSASSRRLVRCPSCCCVASGQLGVMSRGRASCKGVGRGWQAQAQSAEGAGLDSIWQPVCAWQATGRRYIMTDTGAC